MNEDVKLANKKEDNSKLKGFTLMMAVCLIAGFIGGFVVAGAGDMDIFKDMAAVISGAIKFISMYANFVLTIISVIAVFILCRQSRKLFAKWDGEDEAVSKAFEKKLSIAMIIVSIDTILLFVFMAIGIIRLVELKAMGKSTFTTVSIFIYFMGIVGTLLFTVIAQQKIINLTKEMNPEKKGSIFDTKFQKKWFESCDEMEKQQIFEASYASYKAVNTTCMALLIILLVGAEVVDIGVMPICIVGIIWIVSMLSYFIKCLKFE